MAGKVEVSGGPETARAFDKLADDLGDLSAVNERVARGRIPGVATLTPVRTGALRGSWDAQGNPDSGSILSPLPYAATIESGSEARRIEPVAMVRRTLEAQAAAAAEEYRAAVLELARKRGFRIA